MSFDKLVVVTRKTPLEGLIERFNTHGQAKFYIEHSGGDFAAYVREHDAYRRALDAIRAALDDAPLKQQWMDRSFLPTYVFDARDVVLTVGQDGLVANAAKYVGAQPIVAVNPDPERFDGVLLPFAVREARAAVDSVLAGRCAVREVTLAEASLNNGQRLLAFNDLFVGARTHVSARYQLRWDERREEQSSSGIVVATGAGSTGWLSSVFNMADGIARFAGQKPVVRPTLQWEDPRLAFVVREPFASRHSSASIVAGMIERGGSLVVESKMPSGGQLFSDGVESDWLPFDAGTTATIKAATQRARLVARRLTLVVPFTHEPRRPLDAPQRASKRYDRRTSHKNAV